MEKFKINAELCQADIDTHAVMKGITPQQLIENELRREYPQIPADTVLDIQLVNDRYRVQANFEV